MRVIVYLSNPMFVDMYGIWPRVKKQLNQDVCSNVLMVPIIMFFSVRCTTAAQLLHYAELYSQIWMIGL